MNDTAEKTAESQSTDLVIALPAAMTPETFTDQDQFEQLYAKVKEAVDQHVPDVTTDKGRREIASLAYKVARTKTALVGQGKKLTEDWRAKTKTVNNACNVIEERLDRLKEQVRAPLTKWEQDEADRVRRHEDGVAKLEAASRVDFGLSSAELKKMMADVDAVEVGPMWDEFEARATAAKKAAVDVLTMRIEHAETQEAEAAELARLRAEKEERDRREAERLAKEQAAREEAERKERDRKAEEERIAAEKRAEEERLERERQEEERRKAEAERIEREARERADREAAEKVAAAERAAKEAEERAQRQIEDERRQREEQARKEAEEQAARERDKKHRREVNQAVCSALIEAAEISKEQAEQIVTAVVRGIVPHVTLRY